MYSNPNSTQVYPQETSSSLEDFFFGLNMLSGALFFLTILFGILAVIYIIRLWMVQTATFQIQKDLKEIRDWMALQSQQVPDSDSESIDEQRPKGPPKQEIDERTQRKSITFGKPRKSFLLIVSGGTAAVLLAVILYINLG